jgi:hypothetical protein
VALPGEFTLLTFPGLPSNSRLKPDPAGKLRRFRPVQHQGLGKVMEPIEFASTDFFLALMENLWHTLGHGA